MVGAVETWGVRRSAVVDNDCHRLLASSQLAFSVFIISQNLVGYCFAMSGMERKCR